MICLAENADSKNRLTGMLSTLLSRQTGTGEKKQLLSEEFEIPMGVNVKEAIGKIRK
ncbi:MAG: hypothetical protein LUE87_00635 [Lachnospiraceae bacterium]|nr:hypothetical protein [Lachnospiraceae bacterium]